jgi:predicted Zn-dependent peptidase
MTFGRDQNAFTSFDQTTYQLSLPDAKPETLAEGMKFFSDVTGRLLLLPEEIESERQIIQEERRRGLSGRQRTSYYVLEHIAPGSLYGMRLPIGTEETINTVNQQDFRDYYGKWYGAGNATLIVVADTDPASVIKVIGETFGDLPRPRSPSPRMSASSPTPSPSASLRTIPRSAPSRSRSRASNRLARPSRPCPSIATSLSPPSASPR